MKELIKKQDPQLFAYLENDVFKKNIKYAIVFDEIRGLTFLTDNGTAFVAWDDLPESIYEKYCNV